MMMVDARTHTNECNPRGFGSLAIDRAVSDVDGLRRRHARTLHAQPQDVGCRFGRDLVERARDRIEDVGEFQMLDQRRDRRRSISREREPVASPGLLVGLSGVAVMRRLVEAPSASERRRVRASVRSSGGMVRSASPTGPFPSHAGSSSSWC